MDEIDELEKNYYDLGASPLIHDLKEEEIEEKKNEVRLLDIVSRAGRSPIDVRERLNLVERRVEELEKSLVLSNKNFADYRKLVNEKMAELKVPEFRPDPKIKEDVNKLKHDFRDMMERINNQIEVMDERLDKLEKKKPPSSEIEKEISSLKSIVENLTSINKEIVTKTPQFLRELESKVDGFDNKIQTFDQRLKILKEESDKDQWNRPVIME